MKITLEAESDDEEFTEIGLAMELRQIADLIMYGQTEGTVRAPWSGAPIGRWELTR